jgi:predicted RNase H-like nuclease (RuvC/YqgF family)
METISIEYLVGASLVAFVIVGIPIYKLIDGRYKAKRSLEKEQEAVDKSQEDRLSTLYSDLELLKEKVHSLESQKQELDIKIAGELSKIEAKIDKLIQQIIELASKV